MSDGRTVWWAKDSAWWRRERLVELGEDFGAEGPAVIDWLACEAKAQNDGGWVRAGYRAVARGMFASSAERAKEIVERAAEIGVLDDLQEASRTFVVRVSGWAADQQHARNAARQAAKRARDNTENGTARADSGGARQGRDSPLRGVTERDIALPTGQDRTEQNRTNSKNSNVELGKTGGVVGQLFATWQDRCARPKAKLTADRRRKIAARLAEGYTPTDLLKAIDGAARAAFVGDKGQRYDDIELICRSGSKVEDFMARADSGSASRERHTSQEQKAREKSEKLAAYDRAAGL